MNQRFVRLSFPGSREQDDGIQIPAPRLTAPRSWDGDTSPQGAEPFSPPGNTDAPLTRHANLSQRGVEGHGPAFFNRYRTGGRRTLWG